MLVVLSGRAERLAEQPEDELAGKSLCQHRQSPAVPQRHPYEIATGVAGFLSMQSLCQPTAGFFFCFFHPTVSLYCFFFPSSISIKDLEREHMPAAWEKLDCFGKAVFFCEVVNHELKMNLKLCYHSVVLALNNKKLYCFSSKQLPSTSLPGAFYKKPTYICQTFMLLSAPKL